jgi:hypothetical protein
MSTLATALIVAVLAPSVLALITAKVNSNSKREDWKRQDEVAARVEEVSEVLSHQQMETVTKLDGIAKTVDQVHTMSDGALSLAKEQQLDSYHAQMVALDQLADIQTAMGRKPTSEAAATKKLLADKIKRLHSDQQVNQVSQGWPYLGVHLVLRCCRVGTCGYARGAQNSGECTQDCFHLTRIIEGEPGKRGKPGTPGLVKHIGSPGPRGIQGPQGERGAKGAKGEQGPLGLQGHRGLSVTGPPGPRGAIGPQGAQGAQGVQGAQGIQGPPGPPGSVVTTTVATKTVTVPTTTTTTIATTTVSTTTVKKCPPHKPHCP